MTTSSPNNHTSEQAMGQLYSNETHYSPAGEIAPVQRDQTEVENGPSKEAEPKETYTFINTAERQGSSSLAESPTSSTSSQLAETPRLTNRHPRVWKTTLLRAGPLSGLCAMLLAIASIFACLGILVGSNAQLISDWSIQPSEYLAVFTAIANLAMRYGCIQGIVVAWWMGALRGSTLSKLHWDWRSGTTLIGALTSGRQMGWLGLACIASTLVAVDGPLLYVSVYMHLANETVADLSTFSVEDNELHESFQRLLLEKPSTSI